MNHNEDLREKPPDYEAFFFFVTTFYVSNLLSLSYRCDQSYEHFKNRSRTKLKGFFVTTSRFKIFKKDLSREYRLIERNTTFFLTTVFNCGCRRQRTTHWVFNKTWLSILRHCAASYYHLSLRIDTNRYFFYLFVKFVQNRISKNKTGIYFKIIFESILDRIMYF